MEPNNDTYSDAAERQGSKLQHSADLPVPKNRNQGVDSRIKPTKSLSSPQPRSKAPRTTGNSDDGNEADESFERKWVGIVLNIIGRTKHDPYIESQQLSKAAKAYREEIISRGFNVGEE